MEPVLNTMSPEVAAEFRAGIRRFLAEHGKPVLYRDYSNERLDPREDKSFQEDGHLLRWMTDYDVSPYGWGDYDARDHCEPVSKYNEKGGCRWVIEEGTQVTEVSLSKFNDTFSPNSQDEGLHVFPAHCACGKYTDVVLRWEGSIGDILKTLFDYNPNLITL